MGEIVNLGRARKARERMAAERVAAANRARHGRTKTARLQEEAAAARLAKTLDQARREE